MIVRIKRQEKIHDLCLTQLPTHTHTHIHTEWTNRTAENKNYKTKSYHHWAWPTGLPWWLRQYRVHLQYRRPVFNLSQFAWNFPDLVERLQSWETSVGTVGWLLASPSIKQTKGMSDSVRPHRRQPNRLPCPWDSPGKNTGVGCHFLLQCMKVKSEREVAQSCPTLSNPMDCSLPGSSVHGIFQARVLEWGAIAFF